MTSGICSICLDSLNIGETYKMKCSHLFHTRCCVEFLLYEHTNCPLCRKNLNDNLPPNNYRQVSDEKFVNIQITVLNLTIIAFEIIFLSYFNIPMINLFLGVNLLLKLISLFKLLDLHKMISFNFTDKRLFNLRHDNQINHNLHDE